MIEGIGLTYVLDDTGHNVDAAVESIDINNRLPNTNHEKIFTNKVAATSKVRDSNLVEFSLKSKLRTTEGEIHHIAKLYSRLSPISLSLDEELVLTLLFLIERVIPEDLLKPKGKVKMPRAAAASAAAGSEGSEAYDETASAGSYMTMTSENESDATGGSDDRKKDNNKSNNTGEGKSSGDGSSAATSTATSSAPFYVRDLSISGISLNFSCYPARKEFKKQFEHVKKSKRLVSIISLVYKILGNFSNSSIVVTPLSYEEMMFPSGEKFQLSIVSHFVPQLVNKIVESARGTGLFSSVTFLAKAATKAGLMNAIFK